MVDWMVDWRFTNKKQLLVVAVGLVALVGSVSVLGLTVRRVQNSRTTIEQPKANWPSTQEGFISGCKYTDGTPDSQKCPNPQNQNDGRVVTVQGRTTVQNPYAITGLGLGQAYTVSVQPYSGYNSAQSIVCDNRFVCYNNGTAYCIDNVGDSCSSSIRATVRDGTSVTVYMPSSASPADGGTGQPHVDVHWKFTAGTPLTCAQTCTSGCCQGNSCVYDGGSNNSACGTGGSACQTCTGGRICQSGQCQCTGGTTFCGGNCVNPTSDNNNCGSCGNVCGSGTTCLSSSCVSTTRLICANNNTCTTIQSTGNNQGGCTTAGSSCSFSCTSDSECANPLVCFNGSCTDPSQIHLSCVNNACTRQSGAGSNTDNCSSVGSSCLKSCKNDSECPSPQVCAQNSCVDPSQQYLSCTNGSCVRQKGTGVNTNGCTTAGASCTNTCSTDSQCTSPLVCVQGNCTDPAQQHLGCANNSCVRMAGAGNNLNNCAAVGGACSSVTTSNEADSCWGNNGTNGRCYDCNGDGTVNVLDFACFRMRYDATISP